jgi:hypothetical protein
MKLKTYFLFTVLLLSPTFPIFAQQKNLNAEQQKTFLSSRSNPFIPGTFDSVCSYLFAFRKVAIHTESSAINSTRITPTFPDFYRPTWQEIFDLIAWQTKSSWNYDPEQGFWVFSESVRKLPYKIKVAANWQSEDHSIEVVYRPPIAPVGMDIYWLGSYSSDEGNTSALFSHIREELAMRFVRGYVDGVSPKQMSLKPAGKVEALYFETSATNSGAVWRQWVIVEKGQGIAIVSAIHREQEKALLPDVLSMVNSFEVADPASMKNQTVSSTEETTLHRISIALTIATTLHSQSFAKYFAIPVDDDSWLRLQNDGDLGPFLMFKEKASDQSAVILLSDDKSPVFCVYFAKNSPIGVVGIVTRDKPTIDLSQIKAAYRQVLPEMLNPQQKKLRFNKGKAAGDDGQPIVSYQLSGEEE